MTSRESCLPSLQGYEDVDLTKSESTLMQAQPRGGGEVHGFLQVQIIVIQSSRQPGVWLLQCFPPMMGNLSSSWIGLDALRWPEIGELQK